MVNNRELLAKLKKQEQYDNLKAAEAADLNASELQELVRLKAKYGIVDKVDK